MHQMRISTNEVSSVVLGPKKLEVEKKSVKNVKSRKKNHTVPWNWAKSVEEKSYAWGRYPSFLDEFMKFTFLLVSFIHIRIFKQIPKYLATGL